MNEVLGWSSLLAVFGAGLLASLSPCVYPLLPITLGVIGSSGVEAGTNRAKARIFFFVLGQVLAFTALGVVAVALGEAFGFSSESPSIRIAVGVLLVLAGLFSLFSWMPSVANRWNQVFSQLSFFKGVSGSVFTAFLIGMSSALVASPCTSPILGGVLTMLSAGTTWTRGILFMVVYGLGFSFLFLLLGMGLSRISALPRAGRWMKTVHLLSGVALIVTGAYFLVTY